MRVFLVVAFLLFASLAYYLFFSPKARKISFVFEHYELVKEGFTQAEVIQTLTLPDTAFWTTSMAGDSIYELDYNMGDMAPDAVSVYLKNDSVVSVTYCQ